MEKLNWVPVFYNGIETNVEVTKCGKVRKVQKDWYGFSIRCTNAVYGEVDFSKLKLNTQGYKRLKIQIKGKERKLVFLHQLVASAFLNYEFENYPKIVVDHLDNNPLNNNLNNLQVVTQRENITKSKKINRLLPSGVRLHKKSNKYQARIYINKKQISLGYYNDIESASQAYQTKLKSLN